VIGRFVKRRAVSFTEWWCAPATPKDRRLGALVGAVGCFWIGVLGRLMLGPTPVALATLGWWALASIAVGIALGRFFPKATTCVCFPFSMFSIGSGC